MKCEHIYSITFLQSAATVLEAYRITPEGVKYYKSRVGTPINIQKMKREAPVLVNNLLEVSGEKTVEQALTNIYNYQLNMLEYGLERMKADSDFYKKILKRELKEDKK